MENKQIVLFCGSFNPPLNSHLSLAEVMINDYKEIEKVVFVPVNEKYKKADLIGGEHRYNMLKLICHENSKFEVSRMEIDSPRPLYTVETLNNFKKLYPEYEITLAIGSDNLRDLENWTGIEELIKNFKIYTFKRAQDNIEQIIENSNFLKENKKSIIKVNEDVITNISSTYVRRIIRENKSMKYLAPQEIIDYIKENNLYKI